MVENHVASELENSFLDTLDLAGRMRKNASAPIQWGAKVKPLSRGNSMFRGMALENINSLAKILAEGLRPQGGSQDLLFFDSYPGTAFDYAFYPNNGTAFPWPRGIRAIFEVDRSYVNVKPGNLSILSTKDSVPVTAIKRVFIFNSELPLAFPFSVLRPSEFPSIEATD